MNVLWCNPLHEPLSELKRVADLLKTTDYAHGDTYREVCLVISVISRDLNKPTEWPVVLHKYSKVCRSAIYMKHRRRVIQ